MKKGVLLLLLLLFLPITAFGETIESVLGALDLTDFKKAVNELNGSLDIESTLLSLAKGETAISLETLMQGLFSQTMHTLRQSLFSIAGLIAPALILGLVNTFMQGDSHLMAKDITGYVCFLMVAAIMVQDLTRHIALSKMSIAAMTQAMQSLFPLLLSLLAAIGGTAGAAFFQPAVIAAAGFMTSLIGNVTFPCATSQAVLIMLNHVSDSVRLSKLAALFRQVGIWTLGVSFTVFIGVTMMQGFGAATVDGMALRAAKYTIDNFLPIVGGMFADTVDTLVGCSLLIKNALGMTGLILLIGICLNPMVQTLLCVFIYRLCAALLQPAMENRIIRCMQDFSDVLMLLFIIQLSISAMFILLIAQILAAGSMTVMLR